MGLGNNAGRGTFVNIKEGKLYVKKGDQTEFFTDLTGHLTDLNIREDEYDGKKYKVLELSIMDGDERFLLKMRVGSGYMVSFCMQLPNVNFTKPITFCPSLKEENKKKKFNMFLRQDDHALKWWFTKDKPNGLPALKKVSINGEDKWDSFDQTQFLLDMLINKVKPKLKEIHPIMAGPASDIHRDSSNGRPTDANHITEPVDDLPF